MSPSAMPLKAAAPRYAAFLDLLPALVASEAKQAGGPRQQRAAAIYAQVQETAALAPRLSLDPAATLFSIGTMLASVGEG